MPRARRSPDTPHPSRGAAREALRPLTGGFIGAARAQLRRKKSTQKKIETTPVTEDILPSFVNGVVRHANPDLLVNLTNDAWLGDSTEPWIHLALSKLRAVEHRRYLVRATNSGVSAIVDPVGRVVVHSSTFREEALLGEARFMLSTTVYEIIGDIPWWMGTFAVLGMAFFSRRRQAPSPEPKADKPSADKPSADKPS